MENELKQFIERHVSVIQPLSKKAAKTYFSASISGDKEDYQKAAELELKINKIYANKKEFAELREIKKSDRIKNKLLKRQLEILYNDYLSKQFDEKTLKEIVRLQTKNENIYATHRVKLKGKVYSDNQVDEILKKSKNNEELKEFYLASKEIGSKVVKDVLNLVNLRNKGAQKLGFDNYHTMCLILTEQDPKHMDELFDNLDRLTRKYFSDKKNDIDIHLTKRYKIEKSELMPWHYQNRFFQETPEIYDTDLDEYFENEDIEKITRDYYNSIGLPIDDLIKKSDLYEKEKKYQHAYCINIDRKGDVRVLCNIKPNANWMSTMLHEFGHAVYDKFVDKDLPWLLRTHAHIFTTEAIAMFFGRLSSNMDWIKTNTQSKIKDEEEKRNSIANNLKLNLLIFSRWVQVMYRFEKLLYQDPAQDLNRLWWDLVEEYQDLKRPENRNKPDWAAKIHVALYPAYYHNYMLGELFASQLIENLKRLNENYFEGEFVGQYLKKNIFLPGAKFDWDNLIKKACNEKLNPSYFASHII